MTQDELEEESNGSHTPTLALAGFFLFIGVLWRNVDIFILNLSETWLNILPSKIFPLLIILGFFWLFRRNLISSVLGLEVHEPRKHIVTGILVGVFLFLMGDYIAPKSFFERTCSAYMVDMTVR